MSVGRGGRAPIGFAVIALGFTFAALVHAAALMKPALLPPSPAWRHALFVGLNGGVAWGLFRRPRWFPLAFAAFTAQQLVSHGELAWQVWRRDHAVDPSSAIVLVALPLVLAALIRDARAARCRRPSEPVDSTRSTQ